MSNTWIVLLVVVMLLLFVMPVARLGSIGAAAEEGFGGHSSTGLAQRDAPPTIRFF